jgi:hypothetical protein
MKFLKIERGRKLVSIANQHFFSGFQVLAWIATPRDPDKKNWVFSIHFFSLTKIEGFYLTECT